MGLSIHVSKEWPDAIDPFTIDGHPSIELPNASDNPVVVTVCCECGAMRSVLWLSADRWYCRECRVVADNRPKMFPIA